MLRLGKKPFVPSARDFTVAQLVAAAAVELPKAPARFGHGSMFKNWQMLGNGPDNTVAPGFTGAGDCVFAGAAHETMMTNRIAGKTVTFGGAQVVADYSAVTGYVIGDPSTDQGTNVRDALSYRRKTGVVDSRGKRHLIGAYVSIDPKDYDLLMDCVYTFSAVGIGFEFPDSAWDQFDHGEPWDPVPGASIDGGHYVPIVGRASANVAGCVTWAKRQPLTRAFYEQFNDEAWAIVFPEELRNGKTERGMDIAHLNTLLSRL